MNQDIISKRLKDLANTAYLRGIPAFTDFLDLMQQTEYMEFITDKNMLKVSDIIETSVENLSDII